MKESDNRYAQKVLDGWEDVYKKGQLTFWVMLALKDGPKHMAEIKTFIDRATNQAFSVDDMSMYRALRRYYEAELTEYSSAPGNGPDRKIYRLSAIGENVLQNFVKRNITSVLFRPEMKTLIERAAS